jgi:hypothetical protein
MRISSYLLASFSQEIEQCVSGESDLDNGALRISSLGPGYGSDYCNWNKRDLEQSDLQNMNPTLEDRSGIEACKKDIGDIVAQGGEWIVSLATTGAGSARAGMFNGNQIANFADAFFNQLEYRMSHDSGGAYIDFRRTIDGHLLRITAFSFGTMEYSRWTAIQLAIGGYDAMWAVLLATLRHAINQGVRTNSYNVGPAPGEKVMKIFVTKVLQGQL